MDTWNNPCKEVVAHPTAVLSEVKWWSRCGPRLRRERARACLLGPDGAGPDAACSSLPLGSCWASGSAGRGPGGGNGRCPSLCRWCHPSSWSAGLAPWACSCPSPCADLGREKAFQLSRETNIIREDIRRIKLQDTAPSYLNKLYCILAAMWIKEGAFQHTHYYLNQVWPHTACFIKTYE